LDAARLFRLALEAAPECARLHAIGDEGVPVRDIAGVIGRELQVQVESIPRDDAFDMWGFIGMIFSADLPASSALTQKQLGWQPTHAGLLDDLEHGSYF
jgi:nucleoside-diphosphate-sugar epimerase